MPNVRFNHMELTLEPGALDEPNRSQIIGFYEDVFGWTSLPPKLFDESDLLFGTDAEFSSFLLLVQGEKAMHSPGFDHLGILVDTRNEVDRLLAKCKQWRDRDERVRIKEYDDLEQGGVTAHAFYVKFLLPIFFDVQCLEYTSERTPAKRWSYG
jgi:hypothetical protein